MFEEKRRESQRTVSLSLSFEKSPCPNNIIAETELAIDLASAAGLTHSNNALFGNVTNYGGAALPGDGYVLADCLLDDGVEPPSLGAGSPCRDAGSPALGAESSHDFHGTARGASPDIGAIESQP